MRRPIIGIIGASAPTPHQAQLAYEVGRRLGEQKLTIVTGGTSGVMAEASRGARQAGGLVIGILPTANPDDANPDVEICIPSGLGDARNALIANTADLFIAVGGSLGTLSEIAFALKRQKTVIGLDTWALDPSRLTDEPWQTAATAEEAVSAAVRALGA